MRVIIHDLDKTYDEFLISQCDVLLHADGRYAPCQGCLGCWTKHPAECFMKDKLQMVSRTLGPADELTIITENYYGSYSPNVKTVLDRGIGGATPLSTYRGGQMHHCLRYGPLSQLNILVYGDITEDEKSTFQLLAERNAINEGYRQFEIRFISNISQLKETAL